jgi:hypothetical protein
MNALAHEHKAPAATGNPWIANPEDQATVPVPLPVIIVGVEGPYTSQDRKLWAFLLHTVWEELGEKVIHEVPVKEIENVFRQFRSRHHTDWIWESADRLAGTKVKWIRVEGDRRYKGVDNLLGAETDEETQKEGVLRFNFPPLLVPILKDPQRFARLRTHFMIELSGKYAVSLYQLLESAANKENPELVASVEELRRWLKVPEGKMYRWQDFRRKVLEQGIRQINESPEGAGFTVAYVPIKEGRAIKKVRFTINKTEAREKMEERIQAGERQLVLPLNSGRDTTAVNAEFSVPPEVLHPAHSSPPDKTVDNPTLISLLTEAGLSQRDARKIARERWDYVDAEADPEKVADGSFESYIREKIDLLQRQEKTPRSRTGFLLKAIRENWVNPAFAEQEKKTTETHLAMQKLTNEQKRERLRDEKEQILRERDNKKRPICEELLTPALAEALLCDLVERKRYNKSWLNHGLTALENYKDGGWFAMAMDEALEERYPDRLRAINQEYQPRLDALDAKIKALG